MTAYQNLREYVETDGTNPYPHGGEFETITDVAVVCDLLRDAVAAVESAAKALSRPKDTVARDNAVRAVHAILARAEEQGVV